VNDTNNSTAVAAVEEGRYIKGDPLNGYYDFLINEGSYKFWAIFQVSGNSGKTTPDVIAGEKFGGEGVKIFT
jgi:hypothetical protein